MEWDAGAFRVDATVLAVRPGLLEKQYLALHEYPSYPLRVRNWQVDQERQLPLALLAYLWGSAKSVQIQQLLPHRAPEVVQSVIAARRPVVPAQLLGLRSVPGTVLDEAKVGGGVSFVDAMPASVPGSCGKGERYEPSRHPAHL